MMQIVCADCADCAAPTTSRLCRLCRLRRLRCPINNTNDINKNMSTMHTPRTCRPQAQGYAPHRKASVRVGSGRIRLPPPRGCRGPDRAGVALVEHLAEVGVHGGGLPLVDQLARTHGLEEVLGVHERLTTEKRGRHTRRSMGARRSLPEKVNPPRDPCSAMRAYPVSRSTVLAGSSGERRAHRLNMLGRLLTHTRPPLPTPTAGM
jgi:hypothetical protein